MEKNKGDIELQIETSFNPYSVGFIIEGILNGKRESSIYITAHHDHWFNGFRDNMASLLTLLNIERSESELHLVSFTAEESGSPSFSSWSWSYGSLNFLEKRKNKLDNITLNINLDNLETSNIEALATPGISNIVYRLLNTKIEIDPYNDGYSFIKYGIPSIMIESRSSPVYHSNKDDLDKKIFSYAIKELPILIQKIIGNYIDSNKNYKEVTDFIKNESSYLTTNLKSYVTNLTEELFRKDEMIYRNILRLCGATITPIDSTANVKLFPVLYGVSNVNKSYIDIENFGRIDRLIDNGYGLLREYLIYLDAIKEEYSEIYINEIYNALKKFF
ncbi:M28 family peptidase [Sulfuracidifex metallicus]|uniref:M28 family peptidase n=1 Tax=Sulfuracidifex metallicus TaxID=47303 RepID=UPI000ACBE54E|nr:M28 family peptidase [Sulfuracidifex metallicus]